MGAYAIDVSKSGLRTCSTKRSNTSSGAVETKRRVLLKSVDSEVSGGNGGNGVAKEGWTLKVGLELLGG